MPSCLNCGAFVTRSYARVFAPDENEREGTVRACPACDDVVRDAGRIRAARAPTEGGRR